MQRTSTQRRDKALPRHIACFLALALASMAIGCGRQSESLLEATAPESHDGMSATEFLQSVFARYRSAQSYRDKGQVRLSYRSGPQLKHEVAPLRIWFDRDSLYVNAYDVHLLRRPDALTAWITDPRTANFDSQVVRAATQPGRPTIHGLLSDTVLRERITAGLAGPPPQLEWLFAADPMKLLFDGPYDIAFGKPLKLQDRDCVTVVVQSDEGAYRFAVDQRSGVIRQVQLPAMAMPARLQSLADDGVGNSNATSEFRLTLELDNATFQAPTEQPEQAPLPIQPKFVSHFIPLPPEKPSELLDTRLIPLSIVDQSGRHRLTHRGLQGDFTVVLLTSDRSADIESASNLIGWAMSMPADLRQRLSFAIVTNEFGFRRLPRDCPIPLYVDDDKSVFNAIGAPLGKLLIVNRDARIVWEQDGLMPDSVSKLGRILGDLLDGIDVPTRLISQWQNDRATYESLLNAEVARMQTR